MATDKYSVESLTSRYQSLVRGCQALTDSLVKQRDLKSEMSAFFVADMFRILLVAGRATLQMQLKKVQDAIQPAGSTIAIPDALESQLLAFWRQENFADKMEDIRLTLDRAEEKWRDYKENPNPAMANAKKQVDPKLKTALHKADGAWKDTVMRFAKDIRAWSYDAAISATGLRLVEDASNAEFFQGIDRYSFDASVSQTLQNIPLVLFPALAGSDMKVLVMGAVFRAKAVVEEKKKNAASKSKPVKRRTDPKPEVAKSPALAVKPLFSADDASDLSSKIAEEQAQNFQPPSPVAARSSTGTGRSSALEPVEGEAEEKQDEDEDEERSAGLGLPKVGSQGKDIRPERQRLALSETKAATAAQTPAGGSGYENRTYPSLFEYRLDEIEALRNLTSTLGENDTFEILSQQLKFLWAEIENPKRVGLWGDWATDQVNIFNEFQPRAWLRRYDDLKIKESLCLLQDTLKRLQKEGERVFVDVPGFADPQRPERARLDQDYWYQMVDEYLATAYRSKLRAQRHFNYPPDQSPPVPDLPNTWIRYKMEQIDEYRYDDDGTSPESLLDLGDMNRYMQAYYKAWNEHTNLPFLYRKDDDDKRDKAKRQQLVNMWRWVYKHNTLREYETTRWRFRAQYRRQVKLTYTGLAYTETEDEYSERLTRLRQDWKSKVDSWLAQLADNRRLARKENLRDTVKPIIGPTKDQGPHRRAGAPAGVVSADMAVAQKWPHKTSQERKSIFEQNLNYVELGLPQQSGIDFSLKKATQWAIAGSGVFRHVDVDKHKNEKLYATRAKLRVVNRDTIDYALDLDRDRLKPLVIDMAHPEMPGGGAKDGTGNVQEEQIVYRSNLYSILKAVRDKLAASGDLGEHGMFIPADGGIYCNGVIVFREGPERDPDQPQEGYALMSKVESLDIFATAAFRHRNRRLMIDTRTNKVKADAVIDEEYHPELGIADEITYWQYMRYKIETMCHAAIEHKNDSLVLGAFGCGAFGNPIPLVIWCISQAIVPFLHAFKRIDFAVLDANGRTYDAFRAAFDDDAQGIQLPMFVQDAKASLKEMKQRMASKRALAPAKVEHKAPVTAKQKR